MKDLIQKFLPQTFNDFLAITLIILILLSWVAQGCTRLTFPGEVNGALIAVFTLVAQYYFRKKSGEK